MILPIFELVYKDETDGIEYIALVDAPAIERTFQAFSKDDKVFKFQADEKEERVLRGAIMLADTPIYRNNKEFGEHYVVFRPDTIKKLVLDFFRKGRTGNVNLMHETEVEGVFMFESMLIDRSKGIVPPEGFDGIPDGSWFGSFKVDNDEVWEKFIRTGEFTGFSIEGMFTYGQYRTAEQEKIELIIKIISEIDD